MVRGWYGGWYEGSTRVVRGWYGGPGYEVMGRAWARKGRWRWWVGRLVAAAAAAMLVGFQDIHYESQSNREANSQITQRENMGKIGGTGWIVESRGATAGKR